MPESVTDRPAKALEYVFMFAKQERYFWDMEAVKQKGTGQGWRGTDFLPDSDKNKNVNGITAATGASRLNRSTEKLQSRNFRNADLWFQSIQQPHGLVGMGDELVGLDVTSEPLYQAHFAAFPCALVEPFVKAGTSLKGCCPKCGMPWHRKVEKDRKATRPGSDGKVPDYYKQLNEENPHIHHGHGSRGKRFKNSIQLGNRDPLRHCTETKTIGWEPGCKCGKEPTPCVVMDPFAGAGTTLLVSQRNGRKFLGIELNKDYVELASKRLLQRGELGGPRKEKSKGFLEKI